MVVLQFETKMVRCSGGLWRDGYGGLIAREDEPVMVLMATWWPYGGALLEPGLFPHTLSSQLTLACHAINN
ncbi:hypothetical protein VIGAN_05052000 [Vigna angularis var. angularis]|uniref:Uncharacterized protein n=1 Tax=Vigna angularis var. angularis TaxID=157739 RepID=A0A0S3S2Y3_PHAAN|nr:hypothetical protein VIGAN_05052000 [Vigna angularis var. angularis]